MCNYNKLFKFINYFEDKTNEFYTIVPPKQDQNNVLHFGYPIYNDKVIEFIGEINKVGLMKLDYIKHLESYKQVKTNEDLIENGDFETIKAILTSIIRGERFSESTWCKAIDNGTFVKILKKLKEFI